MQKENTFGANTFGVALIASDGRNEGDTNGQNDKGLATRKRIPKDSFYFYKSVWNDKPMLHLTEKGFSRRGSIVPQIKVYSNADSAELYIDGVSQGTIKLCGRDFMLSLEAYALLR